MTDIDCCPATLTAMFSDAIAVGDAALRGDFDEARFRTHELVAKAYALGFTPLAVAAALLEASLGSSGSPPRVDYGASMLRVADALNAVRSPL